MLDHDALQRFAHDARQRAQEWREEAAMERKPDRRQMLVKWAENSEENAAFYESRARLWQ